jgi:hypothetical protein
VAVEAVIPDGPTRGRVGPTLIEKVEEAKDDESVVVVERGSIDAESVLEGMAAEVTFGGFC